MKNAKNYVPLNELIGMLNTDKNIIDDSLNEKIFWEHSYVSIINC